jgi:hypothetical protein
MSSCRALRQAPGVVSAHLRILPRTSSESSTERFNAALADPQINNKSRIEDLGSSVVPASPTEFGKFIAAETEKWANVIKSAGIKPE